VWQDRLVTLVQSGPIRRAGFGQFIFLEGGAYNAAIARMLLAASLWLTITHPSIGLPGSWDYYLQAYRSLGWVPKGLAKVTHAWLGSPPTQDQMLLLHGVAKVACIAMFAGLLSRTASIVAALSVTLYASLASSFGPYWSHGYNVQLLAALAFMFGRSGDVLSVDAAMRKALGRPDPVPAHQGRYWWPVLFAELATHLFMFGAFYQKVTQGNGIWWAWSDNLRNSLAITWGISRFNPPEIATWLMDNAWLYKTAGTLQLAAQFSTVFCLFLVRRPLLRFVIGGLFFLLEIVGLGHLFQFWHPFWVPLCFLSMDWEWLWRRLRSDGERSWLRQALAVHLPGGPAYRTAVYAFMALFFGYYGANIVWRLGERHLNYPFSSMAFYSENRALRPFSQAHYFPLYRGWSELETGVGVRLLPEKVPSGMLDSILGAARDEQSQRKLHESQRLLAASMETRWRNSARLPPNANYASIRTSLQIVAVPPRPQPALPLAVLHAGLTSVSDAKGFRGVHPVLTWDEAHKRYFIEVRTFGFPAPSIRVLARKNVREAPSETAAVDLAGEWQGHRFYVRHTGDSATLYTLIEVSDAQLGVQETYYGPDNFQSYR
jgi:hypothetical protein